MSLRLLTGGEAVAYAMRQIDPDVVPAYPITPQTPIIQGYAKFVADGVAHGELIDVESEHSAMSAAIGSASGKPSHTAPRPASTTRELHMSEEKCRASASSASLDVFLATRDRLRARL